MMHWKTMSVSFRFSQATLILFLLIVVVTEANEHGNIRQELNDLQRRVAQIEQALKLQQTEVETPFLQHIRDHVFKEESIRLIKGLLAPIPVIKNGRQTTQPTIILAVVTWDHQLILCTETGHIVLRLPLPTTCDVSSIDYANGEENLLAVAGCDSIHIGFLNIWKDAISDNIQGSVSFEDSYLQGPSAINSVSIQNNRYVKQFFAGTDQGELLVFSRNGTLRHQIAIRKGNHEVTVIQQRPRHVSYAIPTELGFVRMQTWSISQEICKIDKDTDEFISFAHNPKQPSVVYATTRSGRLLVFDASYNRRADNRCGLRFSINVDPGLALSVSAVADFVFTASSRSLTLFNVTGDPLLKPRMVFSTSLNFSNSASSPLLSLTSQKAHVRLHVAERGGTQVRAFSMALMEDAVQPSFNLPRTPIFLLIMFGTVIYHLGSRKLAKKDSELSDDDKRMIDAIIKRNQCDQIDVTATKEFDSIPSQKSRELRHRRIGSNFRQGEVSPPVPSAETSEDDDEFDERRKKMN